MPPWRGTADDPPLRYSPPWIRPARARAAGVRAAIESRGYGLDSITAARGKTDTPGASLRERSTLSLVGRIFILNAAIIIAAAGALALTPATVSAPVVLGELAVLVVALAAILVANLVLLRRAFAPLRMLTRLLGAVEPLQTGERVPAYGGDVEIVELTSAYNKMLDRLEDERRESVRRTLAAQEGERARVARELHDEIGQSLTAHLLHLQRVLRTAPPELEADLVAAREATRETLEQVRGIARLLRPEALDDLGLENAIASLCQRVVDQSGLPVKRQLAGDLPPLSPEAELVLYRVAQEALTNVLRHAAGATSIELELRGPGEVVSLRVRDDGSGLNGARSGAGIEGMRERALLVSGSLRVGPGPRGGTEVALDLPAGGNEA